ncbi:hypothetical protein [Clostridium grantii]|uniref:hypothetical protein n=1 Tax=Clostridium grantii TaxID=40575 RepID=UPI000934BFAF|nr:hypothetical protein [Clostridium grantii]
MSKNCGCNNKSCGIDPCKCALFLLVLSRAGIINQCTGTILVYIFLLCCGFGCQSGSLCCNR